MKILNMKSFFKKVVSVRKVAVILFFISSYSTGHEIFINMNQNYNADKEIIERQKIIDTKNKEKKCDDKKIICEKIFRIPGKKYSKIDSNILRQELFSVLDQIKPGERIDSLVISAHSDGKTFSSQDASNPNFIELEGISALFNSLKEKESKYMSVKLSSSGNGLGEMTSEEKLNGYRAKFKPESLILMSCYSLQDNKNIATWFKSIDSLKFIFGSTNVWPLAGSPISKKLTEQSFKLKDLILIDLSEFKTVQRYFLQNFSPLTRLNHNVSLAVRGESLSDGGIAHSSNAEIINYRQINIENGSSNSISQQNVSFNTAETGQTGTQDLPDHTALLEGVRAIRAANSGATAK